MARCSAPANQANPMPFIVCSTRALPDNPMFLAKKYQFSPEIVVAAGDAKLY
jgi:hypothetical protein